MKPRCWTSYRLSRMKDMLAAGKGNAEIAAALKKTLTAVQCARVYHGLDVPPPHLVTMSEAARELGVTPTAIKGLLIRHGVPLGKWGEKLVTVHRKDVERLKAERGPIHERRPAGYETADEIAARWGVDHSHVRRLLADQPYLTFRPPGCRPVRCWPARDAERLRPPLALTVSGMTGVELAALLGVTASGIAFWRKHEALPTLHAKRRVGGKRWSFLHDPHAVLLWLEANPTPTKTACAAALRNHLHAQEGKAA